MRRLLILMLLSCGGARATCAVQQTQLSLPEYSALNAAATGTLSVLVTCKGPRDSALLLLSGPGVQASGPHLNLQLRQGTRTLSLQALNGAALLSGLRFEGTQTLRFTLKFPAGQWVPVGPYSAAMTLTVHSTQP
ncbi:hypothetical protein [Deinococcus radiotolerans]|uniref:Spore coat protein U domain-containing protein n=1 Tax=Deinococcus radiotolerans TaxID=1309407 RepID=A0ABQ2FLY0_9DEIO|nr:hypothetical protein [Deinococcus radiotolerans]GGL03025.1 hypothetical protein GCM10010844_22020 [Deinococcus radiotolerans]